jgi:Putative metallopeptidase
MSAVKIALGLTLALAVAVFPAVPALADDFRPNRVVVDYIEPRSDSLQGVYERMKKSGVLEELARFMAPMRLPTTLRIWAIECYEDAELMAYYSAQEHAIHFCYEFVDRLEKSRPADVTEEGFVPTQVFLGAMVGLLLHETGHAFVDLFKVPVFGREEDAADQIAEFIALQFDKDLAETVTKGAGWLWLTDARTMLYLDYYAEVNSTSMERFLNYLCLGYGNEPDRFMDLADKFLKARARRCTDEYQQVEKAFTKTVLPYVDPSMLQEVRARRWFAPSMYEWR